MENPKISVIVPVYNAEKYLHRCVDSILAQTFTDFEVLLINDGSTDNSGDICDEYAKVDSRVRVCHNKNSGVSNARNTGLAMAKNKYIIFVDSDDAIDPKLLGKLVELLLKNPDLECIAFNGQRQTLNGYIVPFRKRVSGGFYSNKLEYIKNNSFNKEVFLHLFKKELLDKYNVSFTEGVRYAEDIEFFVKYYSIINNIYSLNYTGYYYFEHSSSVMRQAKSFDDVLDHFRVIASLDKFEKENNYADSRFITNMIFRLIIISIGFTSMCETRDWFKLDWYYKGFIINKMSLNRFSVVQKMLLIGFLLSVIPFILYFKYRKS